MPDIEKEIQEQNGQTANKPDAEETVKGEKEVVSKEEGATGASADKRGAGKDLSLIHI